MFAKNKTSTSQARYRAQESRRGQELDILEDSKKEDLANQELSVIEHRLFFVYDSCRAAVSSVAKKKLHL